MKPVAILFLLFPFAAISQTFHHEIALDVSPIVKQENTVGFIYRYHFGETAARLFISYTHDSKDLDSNSVNKSMSTNTQTTTGNAEYNNLNIRVGWQKEVPLDKWIFYGGADAVYHSATSNSNSSTYTTAAYGDTKVDYSSDLKSTGYGISPVFGFGYSVNEHFFMSFESGLTYLFYTSRNKHQKLDYYYDLNGNETLNNTLDNRTSVEGRRLDLSFTNHFRFYMGFRF